VIGKVTVAGRTFPVYQKTWIVVPPTVSPAELLARAKASVSVPALEPLAVEDLLRWAVLRGMTELRCRSDRLRYAVADALQEDVDLPMPLRALPSTAGHWTPGAAEAALEVYHAPDLAKDETVVCPEPGFQTEVALTAAPMRLQAHLVVLHYRPPTVPTAWTVLRYNDAPGIICAAFDGTLAFEAVYSLYEGDL
jgi:hypothetical protein